jgi:hypothetical protein
VLLLLHALTATNPIPASMTAAVRDVFMTSSLLLVVDDRISIARRRR